MIHFIMQHKTTEAATGYFRPAPFPEPIFKNLVKLCKQRPEDAFLRGFLLENILALSDEDRSTMQQDPFLLFAMKEASQASGASWVLPEKLPPGKSPLAYLRSTFSDSRTAWIELFRQNIFHLQTPDPTAMDKLPAPELSGPDIPLNPLTIDAIPQKAIPAPPMPGPLDVFYAASERLQNHTKLMTSEKRHMASLSPIALLREWDLDRKIDIPGYEQRLTGKQTSYGRGFSVETARAACIMEAAERISAFADVKKDHIGHRLLPTPIQKASFSELKQNSAEALNPNDLLLEAPFPDEAIWWMPGQKITSEGRLSCLVPVQCVLLFSNLPEIQLFTALGSTGLAAGASEEGARLAGLLEVIERDAEATMPHNPSNCFQIYSQDPQIKRVLDAYRKHGIYPFFEDITTEFGIPSYRCLVIAENGKVIRGTGSHLYGKRALLAAMTETPWPFPGPSTQRPDSEMPLIKLEDLPDFSTSNPAADLDRVEQCLAANGYTPIHVPITRSDLRIPVVRSLVPGLEIVGDFDRFSTVNKRLFTRYEKLINTPLSGLKNLRTHR
ncbi:YcaO-like family protein [Desulfobotulus sp. H1]|uniref:YcaO-like family protein n=1 Tax=Desulfobotulus pelophilus TaxID=2823377 RepID=A0ABT3NBZ5_9BACT|nr:YcaO-like family protein [Desulfobotulus pelophilus]MCW7754990.1 YcaO-like family protein [Desulfobotulus pelophilus]